MHSLPTLFSGIGTLIAAGIAGFLWHLVQRVLNATARVEAQFKNNGGSSMRDAVDRIEAHQKTFEKNQRRSERKQNKRLRRLEQRMDSLEAKIGDNPCP